MAITYTPTTNFGAKDSLPTNDPAKVIKGAEFTTEFTAIQTAFGQAAPVASPTFTGTATFNNVTATGTVTLSSVDINGGTIDGVTIGGSSAGAGSFTTLTASGDVNFDSGTFFVDASADAVGIGTTSPSYKTTVEGEIQGAALSLLALHNTGTNANSEARIVLAGGNGLTTRHAYIGAENQGASGGNAHALVFGVNAAAASPAEAMRIDSSGDVGIGTTSPSALGLQVTKGTGVAAGVLFSNPANNWQIETGTTTNYLAFTDNQFDERMRIDATGNVGIGTDSPQGILEVVDTNPVLQIRDSQTSAVSATATLRMGESGLSGIENYWDIKVNGSDGALQFIDNWSGGSGTGTRMVIDDSGNVGIGTINPACGLDVSNGGNGAVGEQMRITSSTANAKLAFVNTGGNGAITQNNGAMIFQTNTANTERMRIDASGNLGVGTASPARTLHVNDVMRLEPRATAPSSPSAGDIFFNSSTNKLQCYDGTAWQDCF